jgi:hypothetical protein
MAVKLHTHYIYGIVQEEGENMKSFNEWMNSKNFDESFRHYGGPRSESIRVIDSGNYFVFVARFHIKEDKEKILPELPDEYPLPTWMKKYTTKNNLRTVPRQIL